MVDDEKVLRETLALVLREAGYEVLEEENGAEALNRLARESFDLVLCDMVMPGTDGITVLKKTRELDPSLPMVLMTAFGTVRDAVEAMKQGAVDYIAKPFIFDEVLLIIRRILEERRQARLNIALKEELRMEHQYGKMIGNSPAMKAVFSLIDKVASTDSTVLISGKSGTGKELVARSVHEKGPRGKGPFLPVNCAAIPSELLESEFFGHAKGAFTGAVQKREGYFKIANGGTLFLDEICSVPLLLQPKLLRAIETKEILPVGARGMEKQDVRIIAATNKNLVEEVESQRFREDLYYRLKVFEIALPSLKEREEDIPLLVENFIRNFNLKLNKKVKGVAGAVLKRLYRWEWKGNIRELENMMERAMIMCDGEFITERDIFPGEAHFVRPDENLLPLKEAVRCFEKEHILGVLERVEGDKKKAAEFLGLSLSSLYRKMDELGFEKNS